MQRVITAKEATVQTASVEIQTMKVGKKQVTMGMFRQLPLGTLLDVETLQLHGVPWGHVNYWWTGDGSSFQKGEKLHVVWQQGTTLRRAIVYKQPYWKMEVGLSIEQVRAMTPVALVRLTACAKIGHLHFATDQNRHIITIDGRRFDIVLDEEQLMLLNEYCRWRDVSPEERAQERQDNAKAREEHLLDFEHKGIKFPIPNLADIYREAFQTAQAEVEEAVGAYHSYLAKRGWTTDRLAALEDRLAATQEAHQDYIKGWEAQWQALEALPQLFIAV